MFHTNRLLKQKKNIENVKITCCYKFDKSIFVYVTNEFIDSNYCWTSIIVFVYLCVSSLFMTLPHNNSFITLHIMLNNISKLVQKKENKIVSFMFLGFTNSYEISEEYMAL